MAIRTGSFAVGLAFLVAGCSSWPAGFLQMGRPQADPGVIDVSGGLRQSPPGFGLVTLEVNGLPQPRSAQALTTDGAMLAVAITKSDHSTIVDGNNRPAVYFAPVKSGVARITLPPLPSTTAEANPKQLTAGALNFYTFLFNSGVAGPTAYSGGTGLDLARYSQDGEVSGKITYDKLNADVGNAGPALLGSGETRGDVSPGFPVTLSIIYWAHINGAFQASGADPEAALARNTLVVSNATAFTEGVVQTLRLRHPGLDPATIDDAVRYSDGATGRKMVRVAISFASSTTIGAKLTVKQHDPSSGTLASNALPSGAVSSAPFTLVGQAQTSLESGNLTQFIDVDFTGLTGTGSVKPVVDFTIFGFTGTYTDVRLLTTGIAGIFSNRNGTKSYY